MSRTTRNRRKKNNRRLLRLWNTKKWPTGFVWWSHSICDMPVIDEAAFLTRLRAGGTPLFSVSPHTETGK